VIPNFWTVVYIYMYTYVCIYINNYISTYLYYYRIHIYFLLQVNGPYQRSQSWGGAVSPSSGSHLMDALLPAWPWTHHHLFWGAVWEGPAPADRWWFSFFWITPFFTQISYSAVPSNIPKWRFLSTVLRNASFRRGGRIGRPSEWIQKSVYTK